MRESTQFFFTLSTLVLSFIGIICVVIPIKYYLNGTVITLLPRFYHIVRVVRVLLFLFCNFSAIEATTDDILVAMKDTNTPLSKLIITAVSEQSKFLKSLTKKIDELSIKFDNFENKLSWWPKKLI